MGKNYCLFFASKMAFIYVYIFQVILGNILLYYIDAKCHFYVVGMYLVLHDMQEYSSCWATVFETEIEFSQHTTTMYYYLVAKVQNQRNLNRGQS